MPWSCYLVTKTKRAFRSLRRYTGKDRWPRCPQSASGHDAQVFLDETDWEGFCEFAGLDKTTCEGAEDDKFPHDDPRWPQACVCGYKFRVEDAWQCNVAVIFQAAGDASVRGVMNRYAMPQLKPGAMWSYAPDDPLGHGRGPVGPDGRHWYVFMPRHWQFELYGPSSNGDYPWRVTGAPPKITVQPSLNWVNVYHGWLRDGIISDDVDGRKLDALGNQVTV